MVKKRAVGAPSGSARSTIFRCSAARERCDGPSSMSWQSYLASRAHPSCCVPLSEKLVATIGGITTKWMMSSPLVNVSDGSSMFAWLSGPKTLPLLPVATSVPVAIAPLTVGVGSQVTQVGPLILRVMVLPVVSLV